MSLEARHLGVDPKTHKLKDRKCKKCNRVVIISGFRDSLALKQYEELGWCQKCQDEMFGRQDVRNENGRW